VALFSGVFFACAIAGALRKPFWHDEIFTLLFARLPSIADMWRAARDGLDLMPPLNAFLTHALRSFTGDGPILTRVPAMVGVWIMCLAVFAIVRRRSNLAVALAAAVLPMWTAAFRYAIEARGYGLMLGAFGLSALAWSEAASLRRRAVFLPVLAVSLAAGAWAHYYGVLNAVPLAAGQLVRDTRRRQPDWAVWAAFAAGMLLMLPLALLAGVAISNTGRSWTLLQPSGLRDAYTFLFPELLVPRLLGAAVLVTVLGRLERVVLARPAEAGRVPLHEVVAGVACLLLPVAGVAARHLGVGTFVPRYGLSAVVGFCTVVPLLVWIGSGHSRAAVVVVCVSGGLMYLQFWCYAPPLLKQRLCYLADPDAARRLVDTDSIDNGLLALRRWTAVSVHDYDRFVEAHATFIVYGAGSGWVLQRLSESGASVRETGVELGAHIYEVARRPPPPPP
jgi:hypothetical protein